MSTALLRSVIDCEAHKANRTITRSKACGASRRLLRSDMRIAEIAPPWFPIPPTGYGGIERVVYDLTEGMIDAGAEVILCAPAGSDTRAELVPIVSRPVGLDLTEAQKSRRMVEAGRLAYRKAQELGGDLIHDHTDTMPPRGFSIPIVRTIHGPATAAAVTRYHTMSRRGDHFAAISHRQQELFITAAHEQYGPGNNIHFAGVIHNPLNIDAAPFYPKSEKRGYIAFLGRCHWEKSPDGAIRVAQAAGVPLMMALRVTTEERAYFEAVVQPLYRSIRNLAKFVGEVSGAEKDELIGHAGAVVFPSPWEEPFGLVLAEAGARGTPVIALARGSAPELVVQGITGFLCPDEEAMAAAVPRAMELDPEACRAHSAEMFDHHMISRQYLDLFAEVLETTSRRHALTESTRAAR